MINRQTDINRDSGLLNPGVILHKRGNLKWPDLHNRTHLGDLQHCCKTQKIFSRCFRNTGNEKLPVIQCPQRFQYHGEHPSIKAPSASDTTGHADMPAGLQMAASGLRHLCLSCQLWVVLDTYSWATWNLDSTSLWSRKCFPLISIVPQGPNQMMFDKLL